MLRLVYLENMVVIVGSPNFTMTYIDVSVDETKKVKINDVVN